MGRGRIWNLREKMTSVLHLVLHLISPKTINVDVKSINDSLFVVSCAKILLTLCYDIHNDPTFNII